jgi:hypothetical protein
MLPQAKCRDLLQASHPVDGLRVEAQERTCLLRRDQGLELIPFPPNDRLAAHPAISIVVLLAAHVVVLRGGGLGCPGKSQTAVLIVTLLPSLLPTKG